MIRLKCTWLAAAMLVAAGCGSVAPSGATGALGTVSGQVQARACGGPPPLPSATPRACVFHPAAGAQVELDQGARQVKTAITDSNGRYTLAVAPGAYVVHVALGQGGPAADDSRTITVRAGQRATADFQITIEVP